MKKALSLLLALTLSLALTVPAFAAELKSFKDVPSTHWAHDAIMEMVDMGLLAGTTAPDANGVGTFSPDSSMNRSHFVVVMARYLYGEELNATPNGEKWYSSAYTLLLNKGILKKTDFENGNLDVAMSRQEMAYVLAKAADAQNKAPDSLVATSKIPDYNSISSSYKDSVVKAYSMGLIAGTDSKGTFNPYGTLNRAQASTVIYRLVNFKNGQDVVIPEVTHTHDLHWIGQRNGTHIKKCVNEVGYCDFGREIIENCTYNYGGIEEWDFCKRCGDIPAVYYEEIPTIPNGWTGVGVNYTRSWDPENSLDGMPNTAAVAEKYGVEAGGYGYAVAMNFVNIDNSIITDGLVLNGFGYSSNEPVRYETAIAMLKDVLDAESANAFVSWLNELDRLHKVYYNAEVDSVEEANAAEACDNYLAPVKADYVTFGNVKVKWATNGNNIMLYILNK